MKEDKFNDIQKGDVVYVPTRVNYGYRTNKSFLIPFEIIKITKTQFTIKDGRRFKKNGRIVMSGSWETAYRLGDDTGFGRKAIDQTTDFLAFKNKIRIENSIQELFSELSIELNSDYTFKELIEIKRISDQLKTKLVK